MPYATALGGSLKQVSEATGAAAKIAAQFASGSLNDAAYTHDIDINDAGNRYLLTKSSTQREVQEETGASISTKGIWYANRAKATETDPLHLHITASSKEVLDRAITKVQELL